MNFISFSGGKGSGVSALIAHELGMEFAMIFADTGIEDEDLHRFNADVARSVGREVITLKDGRTPWDVFIDQRFIGNSRMAKCSTELKVKPIRRWLKKNAAPTDALIIGMGWEESDRLERAEARWAPRPVRSILKEQRVFRWQYDGIMARHGIKPPRLYAEGNEHNNCGGFCVKAGQKQTERLLKSRPERYAYHENEMERAMAAIGPTARPFLKLIRDGKAEYMTLKQFREHVSQGGTVDAFSEAGCGCFTDAA